MELGFAISAGPLSQISVSVFSIDLAVQLATGAYGWWKARDRGGSMLGVVNSKGCQISITTTFNLLQYIDRRKDGLIRGVARNPDGVLSCVTLPNASSASSGDKGLVCLRAVICALLCFYNYTTVVEILVNVLPGTLYTSDQEGGNETIDGPVLSSLRHYVKAAATEEDSDDLRQKLLDVVESKLGNITGATVKDVFECNSILESDIPNLTGALRWILTPVLRRQQRVYPTRSLKVWALALIMAQLGFEVAALMHVVSCQSDYQAFVENVGYQQTYQEVVLVTSGDGPTDPLSFHSSKPGSVLDSKPRIGSIHSIPWIAFRHLRDSQSLATTRYLSEAWDFTFDYVFNLLETPQPITGADYLSLNLEFTEAALESFGEDLYPKLAHIDLSSEFWRDFQWLTFITYHPLKKFATPQGKQSIWNNSAILSQFKSPEPGVVYSPGGEVSDDWYIIRTVVLATIYAVCCKWLCNDDGPSSLLDTEIASCPDYIRSGILFYWTSISPFSSKLLPTGFVPPRGFWAEMEHMDWFQMLVKVFSGVPEDLTLKDRVDKVKDSRDHSFMSVLGFQKNGVVFLPNLLVYPSADPKSWFRYHIRIGQLLDLPLSDDGFVCCSIEPYRRLSLDTWKPDPSQLTHEIENSPPDTVVRIDPEPLWESDERVVVFRARVGGVVRATFSPSALFMKNHFTEESDCRCAIPKASIHLQESVNVFRVSEFTLHASKRINTYDGREKKGVIVQTGGDPAAQVLCLALSDFNMSICAIGCLDVLQQIHLDSFLTFI